ncbi:hypothetical protein EON67_02765, partial [archaeon]
LVRARAWCVCVCVCVRAHLHSCMHLGVHMRARLPVRRMRPRAACPNACSDSAYPISWSNDKHFGKTAYGINSVSQAMQELNQYGSITAAFDVYEDFITYRSGIYVQQTGSFLGGHAVKIIGYGTQNGQDYWVVANSWNQYWGLNGTFWIAKGVDECGIEDDLYVFSQHLRPAYVREVAHPAGVCAYRSLSRLAFLEGAGWRAWCKERLNLCTPGKGRGASDARRCVCALSPPSFLACCNPVLLIERGACERMHACVCVRARALCQNLVIPSFYRCTCTGTHTRARTAATGKRVGGGARARSALYARSAGGSTRTPALLYARHTRALHQRCAHCVHSVHAAFLWGRFLFVVRAWQHDSSHAPVRLFGRYALCGGHQLLHPPIMHPCLHVRAHVRKQWARSAYGRRERA